MKTRTDEAVQARVSLAVLVVEDVESDCALLIRELRHAGYEPTFLRVDTAGEFSAALEQRAWDLVVSDYSLPEFGAAQALSLLQKQGVDIPFIIVSGTIDEETAVAAMRAGAHDYLTKGRLKRLAPAVARELREAGIRDARRRAEAMLHKTEGMFRSLIEGLSDMVVVVVQGNIVYLNPEAIRLLGDAEALLGQSFQILVPPEDSPTSSEWTARVPRGDNVLPTTERTVLGRGGTRLPVQVSSHPVALIGESAVMLVARDLTEQKKAYAQLVVSERMASVGMLAAGVAHEINNPLASVAANLDYALEELREHGAPGGQSEVGQALREARQSSEQVRKIVRDLKIFSRAQDAERRVPVDVEPVLESSLRMAWNEIRHRARLVKDFAGPPAVLGNDGRLGQVFLNLIVNAAQAMPEGRADQNELRVSTRLVGDQVAIEVRDTGSGMPPEVLEKLFTPFFTTKPVGVGTGIGLSICHRLVTSMGGQITVESEVGKGTTFRVLLPITDIEEVAPAAGAARSPRAVRRSRILVIDDDPMVATAVARTLRRDHDVTALGDAREALIALTSGRQFDLILCDLMMPHMTGIELHAELSARAPAQVQKMMFLSGGAFTAASRAFLDASPVQCIEKPFDAEQLRATINDRLRQAAR